MQSDRRSKIPVLITWGRVLVTPLIVVCYFWDWHLSNWLAAGLFAFAGLSDWLDGYLARSWQVTSKFGAFLDPIADKLVIISSLMLIVSSYPSPLVVIAAIVLIAREIFVIALRQWLAEINRLSEAEVSFWGKLKTLSQFFAIFFLLLSETIWGINVFWLGCFLLALSVILAIASLVGYAKTILSQAA